MSATFDGKQTVAEIILARPELTALFEKLGIDYCCGGKKSLQEACLARGLDPKSVIEMLNAIGSLNGGPNGELSGGSGESRVDWTQASLTELCDHIEATHHRYLKEELPILSELVAKVSTVHGEAHPSLWEVKSVFAKMSDELFSHMFKEEKILFPFIRRLEGDESKAPVGSIAAPIKRMEEEHQDSGDALEALRTLTEGYTPPEDACGSYRLMLSRLEKLEKDLHQHIHKENNILFPRAIEMEAGQ